jgi:hypothetical protein
MRWQLGAIDGITVHDNGEQKCGIVTFSVHGVGSSHVRSGLAEKKIHVSVGLAKSTLIYMNRNGLSTVVRASVHYYNTERRNKWDESRVHSKIWSRLSQPVDDLNSIEVAVFPGRIENRS